jgi:hypothetical protein
MAKKAVEVRECDRCGKGSANTWFITGPDGAPREIELCEQHGAPIANAYALGRPVSSRDLRTRPTESRRGASRRSDSGRTAPAATEQQRQPDEPIRLPSLPAVSEPVWR